VQAELVRDRVDVGVIGVHEPLARMDEPSTVLDQRRHRVPADEPAAAQLRVGETGIAELALGHDRYRAPEERGVTLHVEWIRRAAVPGRLPAQDVQDRVVDPHAKADEAVL
jgi:hypothetical protein